MKPIALNMLSALGTDEIVSRSGVPISGMGGISNWKDAAEFLLLGAGSLQVCTAVMHYGFRIIEDLCDGLSRWMDSKGFQHDRRCDGQEPSSHLRVQGLRPCLPGRCPHQPGTMHQVQSLLRRLQRHGASMHRPGRAKMAQSFSPIRMTCERTERQARSTAARSRASARRIASAAGFAITSARWNTASRWSNCLPAGLRQPGMSFRRPSPAVTEDWDAMKAVPGRARDSYSLDDAAPDQERRNRHG